MNTPRQLPARDYLALKAAFRDLVTAAGGPNRAVTLTRGTASLLSRYGAPHEDMFAPADVISDLEAEVGEPVVTRVLADLAGFVLVPKAAVERPLETIDNAAAPVMKEVGDVLVQLGDALRDGVLTPKEAESLLPEIGQAESRIVELGAAVKARAGRAA